MYIGVGLMKKNLLAPVLAAVFIVMFNTAVYADEPSDEVLSGAATEITAEETAEPEETVVEINAASSETEEDVEIQNLELYEIIKDDGDFMLRFAPLNDSLSDISLPEGLYVSTDAGYFFCNISWDSLSSLDTSSPGRIALSGEILPPEGYAFASGLDPYTELAILVYDGGEGTEYAYIYDTEETPAQLIPQGCDIWNYINTSNTYPFYTEHGDLFYCSVTWTDLPDTDIIGTAYLTGEFDLPQGIIAANDESKYITLEYYVMKDDDIYLDYVYCDGTLIWCKWIKSIEDYKNIIVEYTIDGENWNDAGNMIYSAGTFFCIAEDFLEADIEYTFRLIYGGLIHGYIIIETAVYDDSYLISGGRDLTSTVTTLHSYSNKTSYLTQDSEDSDNTSDSGSADDETSSDSVSDTSDSTDGSDSQTGTVKSAENTASSGSSSGRKTSSKAVFADSEDDSQNEDNIQESESSEDTSADEAPSHTEEITDNTTVITGSRLAEQADTQGSKLVFEKNGAALEIPSDFIEKNNIGESDLVSVYIDRGETSVDVGVSVNGEALDEIEGAEIVLPGENGETLRLSADTLGETDTTALPSEKSGEKGFGRYKLAVSIIIAVLLISAGGAAAVWKRKK